MILHFQLFECANQPGLPDHWYIVYRNPQTVPGNDTSAIWQFKWGHKESGGNQHNIDPIAIDELNREFQPFMKIVVG